MVLLKNDGPALPLDPTQVDRGHRPARRQTQHDMLGPWWGQGDDARRRVAVRRHEGPERRTRRSRRLHAQPTTSLYDPGNECAPDAGFAGRGRRGAGRRPGRARARRDARDERRGRGALDLDLPGKQQELIDAIKATGKPFAVVLFNGRPLTLDEGRGELAGDPRGLVRRRRGRQRGRRRAVRQGQPRRQAAGELPAQRRPGADLLQPRADRPPVRPDVEVQLAPPRHPVLRPAVRVRLRAQLHDVQGLEPAAELARRWTPQRRASRRRVDVDEHRPRKPATRSSQLYIHDPVASISQPVRRLRGFQRVTLAAGPDDDGHLHARPQRRRLLRQPRPLRRRDRAHRRLRRRQLERDATTSRRSR